MVEWWQCDCCAWAQGVCTARFNSFLVELFVNPWHLPLLVMVGERGGDRVSAHGALRDLVGSHGVPLSI